ncbi:LADA_0E12838g1_1 [Lachancea dasiensis]|uniref:Telomere replication protein EST3 n=1 Tax=Lachancea dasiensis TaxID=1072105 RepID=A0A1G4JFA3_9SACH|nr:LADA_0E12838g1_1 [Lachancea dasiensis]
MSKVLISYKKKQNESPYLRSWIQSDIIHLVKKHIEHPVWPEMRNFIPPLRGTGPSLFSSNHLSNRRHLVKVTGFHAVHNYTVYGSVRDADCHLLVEFTPQCVAEFERHHNIRLTSNTINTIFLIGGATLKYLPVYELRRSDKWVVNICVDPQIPVIPILVVEECSAFDLDQVETRLRFPYVYSLHEFVSIFHQT